MQKAPFLIGKLGVRPATASLLQTTATAADFR